MTDTPRLSEERVREWTKVRRPLPPHPRDENPDADAGECMGWFLHSVLIERANLASEVLELRAEVERLKGERDNLRRFAEAVVSMCEWGPTTSTVESDEEIWDACEQSGIIVERPHPQPCQVEDCECDGADSLCYFAWSPPSQEGAEG